MLNRLNLLFILLLIAPLAKAQVTFSTDLANNDVTLAAGGTFTFTLYLNVANADSTTNAYEASGLSYFLKASNSQGTAAPGIFSIVGRNSSASVFGGANANTPDSSVVTGTANVLDSANGRDLGGTLADFSASLGSGTFTLGTFTLSVSGSASAGNYIISPTWPGESNGDWVGNINTGFTDNNVSSPLGIDVTIAAAPEPNTSALLFAGACLLIVVRLRRTGFAGLAQISGEFRSKPSLSAQSSPR